jgi:hypothetical protein
MTAINSDFSAIAFNSFKNAVSSLTKAAVTKSIEKQIESSFRKGGFPFTTIEKATPRILNGKKIGLKESLEKLEKVELFGGKFSAQRDFEAKNNLPLSTNQEYYNALLIRDEATGKVTGYYLEKVKHESPYIPVANKAKPTYFGPMQLQP